MALVIEDGTGVAGANSYVELADFKTWAAQRGVTLPAADADIEILLVKGFDYVNNPPGVYVGYPATDEQTSPWPRAAAHYPSGKTFPSDEIPYDIKLAQMQAAVVANEGDLQPARFDGAIKRDKTGPLETEWFESSVKNPGPEMPHVDQLLAKWLVDINAAAFMVIGGCRG